MECKWIKTSDRLPEVNFPVVCIDMTTWQNTGDGHDIGEKDE